MELNQDTIDFGMRQFQNVLEKLSMIHDEFLLAESSNTDNALPPSHFEDVTVLEAMNKELAAEDMISRQRFNDDSRWIHDDNKKDKPPLTP